jgi:sodium-dependent dicarboxylate transporter 2/3/5
MVVTVMCWVFKGQEWGLANIALCATTVLFLLKLTNWREVEEGVNWGVILMYGGAICLGAALHQSGATAWITAPIKNAESLSPEVILICLGALSMVLTELMSNSAVIAVLVPVALEIGAAQGIDLRVVTMAVVLPSNFAFAFPMATPANALAYSSGFLDVRAMMKRGFTMDLIGLAIFALLVFFYWPYLGYEMGH